jgi:hypothetical protein
LVCPAPPAATELEPGLDGVVAGSPVVTVVVAVEGAGELGTDDIEDALPDPPELDPLEPEHAASAPAASASPPTSAAVEVRDTEVGRGMSRGLLRVGTVLHPCLTVSYPDALRRPPVFTVP